MLPAPPGWEGALAEMPPLLSAMVRVQALGGMRPQDICRMRRGELSTRPDEPVPLPRTGRTVAAREVDGVLVWLYAPQAHKTDWAGKPRVIAFGPRAQVVLTGAGAGLKPGDVVFAPRRVLAQARRGNRFSGKLQDTYDRRRYGRLVERAIERTNAARRRRRGRSRGTGAVLEPEPTPAPYSNRGRGPTRPHHAAALLGHASGSVIDTYMK
ncbi:catalytic phage domain protein : Marine sediment metagenome DNA, contig: S01H1_L02182 (Fragment) OS=marine sediment metagenome GN=S01H1_07804 PE=4 SV=1 [Gemmata massiliana]|uniref:Catalytic phage domain protein: Marine sediment metagenome DNA, contig: S01H1_L02182 n=1 Tax=Gemmata massiliana TaxID=1210884 RepID=A0A6P2CUG5_9BACT